MRQQRILNTLLRLQFAKEEQRLFEFQRREAVIELGENQWIESESSTDDEIDLNSRWLSKFKRTDLSHMRANLEIDYEDASNLDKLRRGVIYPTFKTRQQQHSMGDNYEDKSS